MLTLDSQPPLRGKHHARTPHREKRLYETLFTEVLDGLPEPVGRHVWGNVAQKVLSVVDRARACPVGLVQPREEEIPESGEGDVGRDDPRSRSAARGAFLVSDDERAARYQVVEVALREPDCSSRGTRAFCLNSARITFSSACVNDRRPVHRSRGVAPRFVCEGSCGTEHIGRPQSHPQRVARRGSSCGARSRRPPTPPSTLAVQSGPVARCSPTEHAGGRTRRARRPRHPVRPGRARELAVGRGQSRMVRLLCCEAEAKAGRVASLEVRSAARPTPANRQPVSATQPAPRETRTSFETCALAVALEGMLRAWPYLPRAQLRSWGLPSSKQGTPCDALQRPHRA